MSKDRMAPECNKNKKKKKVFCELKAASVPSQYRDVRLGVGWKRATVSRSPDPRWPLRCSPCWPAAVSQMWESSARFGFQRISQYPSVRYSHQTLHQQISNTTLGSLWTWRTSYPCRVVWRWVVFLKIFPAHVGHDPSRQSISEHVDHCPKSVSDQRK